MFCAYMEDPDRFSDKHAAYTALYAKLFSWMCIFSHDGIG
jgi:hypothetical protein